MHLEVLTLLILLLNDRFSAAKYSSNNKTFPDDFMFGAATSAYQIEGGWNADGKGESIWDHMSHTKPDNIIDKSNGDIACDSYHNYRTDVNMLRDLGVNHYRFSIAWTRILPTGFPNKINMAGVNYYKNLIKLLKENNIEPVVTLYHWDLPQTLQELGGWPNPFIIDIFVAYAKICFDLFGDDVRYWLTVNEPTIFCLGGYGGLDTFAPAVNFSGIADYWCGHNLIKAHAAVWHLYDKMYRPTQKGRVSLVVDSWWFEPASSDPKDKTAAETAIQFWFGWFMNPIFNGNYPQIMIDRIAKRSKLEGFPQSRLPTFTRTEIDYIKGTYDFLGFNFYSSYLAKAIPEPKTSKLPSYNKDMGVYFYQPTKWKGVANYKLKITPWGLRKILNWIKNNLHDPLVFIAENGLSGPDTINDIYRIEFIRDHLSSVVESMTHDKVRVIAYTHWTLMDGFEWINGYRTKYGLYHTNFSDSSRSRTPRKSAAFYKKLIKTRDLNCTL